MVNVLAVVLVANSSTTELFMILDPQITCLNVMFRYAGMTQVSPFVVLIFYLVFGFWLV